MANNSDQYNRGGFYALIFSIGFCLVFFVYVSFMHPGVDLKEVPEAQATDSGSPAGDGAAPSLDIATIQKPWIENPDVAKYGSGVYKNNCAVCHGATGEGNGPAGAALVPPPRNLVEGKWRKGGSSIELYVTLQNGIAGGSMAAFKHLPKADRWALVQYIRSITKDKTPDNAEKLEAFAATAD
jgi:mono/diheme cytochrome c family protein